MHSEDACQIPQDLYIDAMDLIYISSYTRQSLSLMIFRVKKHDRPAILYKKIATCDLLTSSAVSAVALRLDDCKHETDN